MRRRPWTRLTAVTTGAHVLYELAMGVGMPFAARIGVAPAALLWAGGATTLWREAGRRPSSSDTAFLVVNGACLAAVVAHLSGWPRTRVLRLPWLLKCEGLSGRQMPAYNLILWASSATAVAGLVENRRGRSWAGLLPLAAVPVLVCVQHRELTLLRRVAARRPRWWNRSLAATV